MEKLSRKARYQNLRENLENVSTEKISQDLSSQPARTFFDESLTLGDTKRGTAILDEVLGEVNQYNLNQRRGNQAAADSDLRKIRDQYLEPLDTGPDASRQGSASKAAVSSGYDPMEIIADEVVEEDNLQTFDFATGDFDKTIRETSQPAVKSRKSKKRKNRKVREEEFYDEADDEQEEKNFSWVNVFLTIIIIILIASICFTGYLIFKSGLL